MDEPKRFPQPVEALILILATIGLLDLTVVFWSRSSDAADSLQNLQEISLYFFIIGGLLFGIVPVLYSVWRRYDLKALFRYRPVPAVILVYSLLCALALTVIGDELDRLLGMLITIPDWLYESMRPLKAHTVGEWIMVIAGAVLVAAVAEETMFRGFLQVALEKKGDPTRAVILSSLTWTLSHQNPYWAVEIFIIGIFIGFLAWRTNSLWPGIVVHLVNNLIAVLLLNMGESDALGWYEWHGHVSPLVLIPAVFLLVWSLRAISSVYRSA